MNIWSPLSWPLVQRYDYYFSSFFLRTNLVSFAIILVVMKLFLGLVHNVFNKPNNAILVSEQIFNQDTLQFSSFEMAFTNSLTYLTHPSQDLIPQDDDEFDITADMVAFLIQTAVLFAEQQTFQSRGYTHGLYHKQAMEDPIELDNESANEEDEQTSHAERSDIKGRGKVVYTGIPRSSTGILKSSTSQQRSSPEECDEEEVSNHRQWGGGGSEDSSKGSRPRQHDASRKATMSPRTFTSSTSSSQSQHPHAHAQSHSSHSSSTPSPHQREEKVSSMKQISTTPRSFPTTSSSHFTPSPSSENVGRGRQSSSTREPSPSLDKEKIIACNPPARIVTAPRPQSSISSSSHIGHSSTSSKLLLTFS